MSFLSFSFILFLIATAVLYFVVPKRLQPLILLCGSVFFYLACDGIKMGIRQTFVLRMPNAFY